MNEYEGFRNYRSPFFTEELGPATTYLDRKHNDWIYYRDKYAFQGEKTDLERMLGKVTLDIPYMDNEPEISNREIWRGLLNLLPYFVILFLGPLLGMLMGGWQSAVTLIVFLTIIFVISWKR